MEKSEAFRKKVLSHLYGLPDPTESANVESGEDTLDGTTKDTGDKDKVEEKIVKDADKGSPTEEDSKDEVEKNAKSEVSEDCKSQVEKDTQSVETKTEGSMGAKSETSKDLKSEVPEAVNNAGSKDTHNAGSKDTHNDSSKDTHNAGSKDTHNAGSKDTHNAGSKDTHNAGSKDTQGENVKDKEQDHQEDDKDNTDNNSVASDATITDSNDKSSTSKTTTTSSTPTTTTSHLYTVLMAPLDGRPSMYRGGDITATTRSSGDDTDGSQRKRIRLDKSSDKGSMDLSTKTAVNTDNAVDLTKNQKRKLKKKRRKHLLNKLEVQRAKDFIYSSENEQFTVEKLRTMIEDVTEFLDAIWDVYCSEARLKGESVEEDGYRAAAVLKCLSASGEGSWTDLKLLSRAKSVLVLRSKNLAASTILRVENELGYDPDIRTFIVRMLRFWMDEIVNKG